MKNLGWNRFANIAPNNPTQTRLTRFMKMPGSDLTSEFSKLQKDFEGRFSRFTKPTLYRVMYDDIEITKVPK
jgi:hypothetical protein